LVFGVGRAPLPAAIILARIDHLFSTPGAVSGDIIFKELDQQTTTGTRQFKNGIGPPLLRVVARTFFHVRPQNPAMDQVLVLKRMVLHPVVK
jgi:hypothetical protein